MVTLRSNQQKTVAKHSYSLICDLHGMQGSGSQIPLAPLGFKGFEDYNLIRLVQNLVQIN